MELLDLYSHAEHRHNRFIFYICFLKLDKILLVRNPDKRAILFKITMNILKKIGTVAVANSG